MTTDANKSLKILIIDDSDFDATLLSKALEKKGHKTRYLQDGRESLSVIDDYKPDLILLDSVMPHTSGEEILKSVREKFNTLELPVIMITSKSETSDIVQALHLGANDYITKPVNLEIALMRINTQASISYLSREMSQLREVAAFNALVATYNHEINNPLTIAVGLAHKIAKNIHKEDAERLQSSLCRMAKIVKKIKTLSEESKIEFDDYAAKAKMVKLK